MLRIKDITGDAEPVKTALTIRGETITLWLRPWDAQIVQEIRRRHVRGFEWVQNPATGRREKAEIVDDDAFFDALVDYIIAGFEGVGDESGTPWPQTLPYKKRLIAITVERGAQPVWEQVLELAKDLAFARDEREAELAKN